MAHQNLPAIFRKELIISLNFILAFFTFTNSFSQTTESIDYSTSGMTKNISCNAFNVSPAVSIGTPTLATHYPVVGGVFFNGSSINLQTSYEDVVDDQGNETSIDQGTDYAIHYSFTAGWTYKIQFVIDQSGGYGVFYPDLWVNIGATLPQASTSCGSDDNPTLIGSAWVDVISNASFSTATMPSFVASAGLDYLLIGAVPEVTGLGTNLTIGYINISKIVITGTPPAAPCTPGTPTGLTTANGFGTLEWTAASNAATYDVVITDTHNGTPTTTTEKGITTTSLNFCPQGVGDAVSFTVQGFCSNGDAGAVSLADNYTYSPVALPAPTGLTYTPPSTLSWNAVAGATGYVVNASGAVYPVYGTSVSGSSAELSPGNAYNVSVSSFSNNCVYTGPFSTPIQFTATNCTEPVFAAVEGAFVMLYAQPNTSSYNIWFINSTGAPTKPFAACSTITSSGCNFSNAPYNLPSGTYYIEAQANCTIGGLTPWSPPYEGYPQEASIGSRLMRVSGDEDSLDLPATTVKFSVYPNPSASQINILYYAQQNGSTDLLILNELGTTVVHKKVGTIAGQNSFSLNIGELANGVYFVKLMDGNNMHVQKLVVQK